MDSYCNGNDEERDASGPACSFSQPNSTLDGLRAGSIVIARASSIWPSWPRMVRPEVFERLDISDALHDIPCEGNPYGVLDLESVGETMFRVARSSLVLGMVIYVLAGAKLVLFEPRRGAVDGCGVAVLRLTGLVRGETFVSSDERRIGVEVRTWLRDISTSSSSSEPEDKRRTLVS